MTAALFLALMATIVAVAVRPAPASAQYYWGCTYSYGAACFGPAQNVNFLITQDPDHALTWGEYKTNNGYKLPKYDGRERCVASTIYNGGQLVPWVSGWGQTVVSYPGYYYGQPLIGTCAEYFQIALYQMVDYAE